MNKTEFLSLRRLETPKTLRLLELYPEEKADLKPSEKARSALQLVLTFLSEERANGAFIDGGDPIAASRQAVQPKTFKEGVAMLRAVIAETDARIESLSDAQFETPIRFFDRSMPLGGALTIMLLDHIHHRGQFTIYSRIAGARVPQIYGPSADEPMS
jgi:uncharacterized damage-inducible protein DinB